MGPAKLYRTSQDGAVEYWESWVEDGGRAVVHWGRLGERGEVRSFDGDEFAAYLAPKVRALHAEGYRDVPEEEQAFLLVAWPPDALPYESDDVEVLWDRVELLVDEELGWTGLGRCTGVDFSSELVAMAVAVDAGLAVGVLAAALSAAADLPAGAVIAVRSADGRDVIRWPAERAGEELGP